VSVTDCLVIYTTHVPCSEYNVPERGLREGEYPCGWAMLNAIKPSS